MSASPRTAIVLAGSLAVAACLIFVRGHTASHRSQLSDPVRASPRTSTTVVATQPSMLSAEQAHAPVIVVDPGHGAAVRARDAVTGLDVSSNENEPETRDVWAVATLVRAKLQRHGYRVVFTRSSVRQKSSLADRATIANREHAALALSIHDQAGSRGGVGFSGGNNIVYYQAIGKYRSTPAGKKIVFRDESLARTSKQYGAVFARQRQRVQGVNVRLQDDVGYDLGSRHLAPGNIWLVQLLARVPWIYNEAGGNSKGQIGLSLRDKQIYADALVQSVEACVPPQS